MPIKKITKKTIISSMILSGSLLINGIAMAQDVPVIDAYQYESGNNAASNNYNDDNYSQAYQQPLTTSQQLHKLQQQMQNLQAMNFSEQVQQLQQQVEKLQGQLQVQEHEIQKLKQQNAASVAPVTQTSLNQSPTVQTPQVQPKKIQAVAQPKTATPVNVSTQTIAAAPAQKPNTNNFLSDTNEFQAAYNLIVASKYPAAITAMNNYLQQYPNGQYAANAYYWLGELYLLQNNDVASIKNFQTVVTQYPSSKQVQDAMLKLGLIYYDSGNLLEAKTQLQKVVNLYPNTAAARLASARLLEVKQQLSVQPKSAQTQVQVQTSSAVSATKNSTVSSSQTDD